MSPGRKRGAQQKLDPGWVRIKVAIEPEMLEQIELLGVKMTAVQRRTEGKGLVMRPDVIRLLLRSALEARGMVLAEKKPPAAPAERAAIATALRLRQRRRQAAAARGPAAERAVAAGEDKPTS